MDEKIIKELTGMVAGQIGASSVVSIYLTTALLKVLIEKNIASPAELETILRNERNNIVSDEARVLYDHAMTTIFGQPNQVN